MSHTGLTAAAVTLLGAAYASTALGEVGFLAQDRFIQATTSIDGNTQTIAATDFSPFVATLDLQATFQLPGGGIAVNRAFSGIDCELDPNRVRLAGTLGGAGGVDICDGNGFMEISVLFEVVNPLQFVLTALPRPSADPEDRFKLSFAGKDGPETTFIDIDENDPAQSVFLTGMLPAGIYEIEFEAEYTVEGPEDFAEVGFVLNVPAPGAASLGVLPGVLALRRRRRG